MNISSEAYAKIMLHLVKHPHAPVCGMLLGSVEAGGIVVVSDAVPLFHTHALAPLLEAATQMIDQEPRNICGYYHVNERADDRGVPIVAERICSSVESKCPGALLLQVLNDKLSDPLEHALQV